MGLRDIGQKLPPGFRFYPSDEELVCHYLYRKVANDQQVVVRNTLVEIDLHTCEPWQLPDVAKLNSEQWYFFSLRDRKYATGFRTNRATTSGYWKATGKDRAVVDPKTRAVVGMRKTLVFYKNRAPNGLKTGWIMHEFRLENPHVPPTEDWVLCRVFHKTSGENSNKLSPQNYMYDSTQNLDYSFSTNEHYSLPIANKNTTTSFYHSSSHHQQYCHEDQNLSSFLGLSELDTSRYSRRISHDDHNIDNEANPSTSHDRNESKFVETKCEDDYGFDMSFDYTNGGQSNLDDDMRFDYDNSSIFI